MIYQKQIDELQSQLISLAEPPQELPNVRFEITTGVCDKHGDFEQRCRIAKIPGLKSGISQRSQCPVCLRENLEELKRNQSKHLENEKASNIERLMRDLNLPRRFKESSLENYQTVTPEAAKCLKLCKAYAARWLDRRRQGGGMVMCGKPGTGKNHLALAIAKEVISTYQHSAIFTTAMKIARAYKATWAKDSDRNENDVINTFTHPDLLIIDEIGVQFGSEAEKMILFEVINTRYEQMKPTIIISNLAKDELADFIGERIIDRMNDGGGCTLSFTWESYRSAAR